MEPGLTDHVLFGLLVALPVLAGRRSFDRLKRAVAGGEEGVRLRYYRRVIVLQWTAAAVVLGVWFAAGRAPARLGLVPWRGALPAALGLIFALVAAWLLLRQHCAVAGDPAAAASARRQIGPLLDFLPHDEREDRWFAALSVTAGICEEISHRGFLIAYLGVWLGLWPAALASAVLFGISHVYQGASGVLRTGLAGAGMAVLYVACGWLLPAMVLHAGIDVGSARVVRVIRQPAGPSAGSPQDDI